MEYHFDNKKIKKEFTEFSETVKAYGMQLAKGIHKRLQEFEALTNLEEIRSLPGPKCHELTGPENGLLSVHISGNFRILFKPSADPKPVKDDGGLDWSQVTAITIVRVKDYH